MRLTTFDRLAPWSGALAAVCWVGQDALARIYSEDSPGHASHEMIQAHLGVNYASQGCLVVMGISLLFFATSVRSALRSGEGREATYSSVAYGGWLVMAAGLSQMVVWNWGLMNGASEAGDDAALTSLSYVAYFGWAGMGIGVATAFIATGWGGIRSAVLPRWFAVVTIVLGALGALGNAGIPPGGLVTYVLLPVWLVTASVVLATSHRRTTEPVQPALAS